MRCGCGATARKIKQAEPHPGKIRKMTTSFQKVQPALGFAARHLDEDVSLAALAQQTGLSAYHLHRMFSAVAGETPKRFTLRLRLGRAAAMLLTTDVSVLNVALDCGFRSHEVFCRTFRRRFGMTPSAYRARGFAGRVDRVQARSHAALVAQVSPCVGLYHHRGKNERFQRSEMAYSIVKKKLETQPVLVVRRRVKPSEIAKAIAEVFPPIYAYAQQHGIAMAGQPITRYLEWGPGLWTIEAGMPVAGHSQASEGDVRADTLPGGFAATTTHAGAYDKLSEAHAAIQQWIEAEGYTAAGAPWEVYVTDPADYPDPKDWKTDIYWPIAG
jgi:AraC family transcriptional regulator